MPANQTSFKPGQKRPPGSGRKPGSANVVTRHFKDTLAAVLAEPETESRLRALRESDEPMDRSTFWRMAAKFVPAQVEARVETEVRLRLIDLSDERGDSTDE